jgi:putative hydrolase of the HAD superfamily
VTIRGVIFDFGGVIHNMRFDVMRQIEAQHGLERDTILRTLYDAKDWHEIQIGRGDIDAWHAAAQRRLDEAAGRPMPPLHVRWRESWHPIEENVALIRALRPPYRLAVLSNADRTLEDRMRDGLNIHHLFDTVVCSAIVGMAKPDRAVYRLAAERLGLAPEECVFIDDFEHNVKAAQEVGMAAIHFRVHKGDSLAAQLGELGVRPSPPA